MDKNRASVRTNGQAPGTGPGAPISHTLAPSPRVIPRRRPAHRALFRSGHHARPGIEMGRTVGRWPTFRLTQGGFNVRSPPPPQRAAATGDKQLPGEFVIGTNPAPPRTLPSGFMPYYRRRGGIIPPAPSP